MLTIEVQPNGLEFYDQNDRSNKTTILFHRTLRIPDDGKTYPLPPSLGLFPIKKVDDFIDKVPEKWKAQGGVFIPMYQREAMWMQFFTTTPKALKVAIGKINAVTGKPWTNSLEKDQDYMVLPDQPWLDGINSGDEHIKQFIAMPLGSGYTVEHQVTGKDEFGGAQLMLFDSKVQPPKETHFAPRGLSHSHMKLLNQSHYNEDEELFDYEDEEFCDEMAVSCAPLQQCFSSKPTAASMKPTIKKSVPAPRPQSESKRKYDAPKELGLAAGGSMSQTIAKDKYGLDHWSTEKVGRCFVHIVNSTMYEKITGEKLPETPVSARTYTEHGYPWFDYYAEGDIVKKSDVLSNIKSVSEIDKEKYAWPQQDDSSVHIPSSQVKVINNNTVRDGDW